MRDLLGRIAANLADRVSGPMRFRLVLQPLMAAVLAIRGGLRDAREGRPPYFWALFTAPSHRRDMLQDGWKAIGKVFVLAIALDVIYQFIVRRSWIYPGEAFLVAVTLALMPYLLIRGLATRIARRRAQAGAPASQND